MTDWLFAAVLIGLCVAAVWWASDSERVARLAAARRAMGLPGQERTMRVSAVAGAAVFIVLLVWLLVQ
ncbi:MAG: hypothetical protein AB7Q27_22245 [Acidimicrobiia bacterium]